MGKKLTEIELINKSNIIHNFKYKINFNGYTNIKDKVVITCPNHGNFKQIMSDHLNGRGCSICAVEKNTTKKRNNIKELINRANKIHDSSYIYNLNEHKSMHDNVDILCQKHGIFNMSLHSHINKKRGCKKCAIEKVTMTKSEFIQIANKIHNNKYDYSKVNYINGRTKIIIICPEHSDFLQLPRDHINKKNGCPICNESKGERLISILLDNYNIKYVPQKSFFDLKYRGLLYFEFYLPELNMCIEFDGEHHFKPITYWGGDKTFKLVKKRDKLKNDYCKLKNIPLLRISHKDSESKIEYDILYFIKK